MPDPLAQRIAEALEIELDMSRERWVPVVTAAFKEWAQEQEAALAAKFGCTSTHEGCFGPDGSHIWCKAHMDARWAVAALVERMEG